MMMSKEECKSYIAYFDLLGIKAIADFNFSLYYGYIKVFHEELSKIIKTCKNTKVYSFSDCAYMESSDLNELLDVLVSLRKSLILNQIFFNAALTEGKLNAKINSSNVSSARESIFTLFESADVVKAFSMQVNYSGIGVFVDASILNNLDKNMKNKIENRLVDSAFCTSLDLKSGEFSFRAYKDVKYFDVTIDLVKYIIENYITTMTLNVRASRYYLSALYTCLNQLDFNILTKEYIPEVYKKIRENKMVLDALLPVDLIFINALYCSYKEIEHRGGEQRLSAEHINKVPKIKESLRTIIQNSSLRYGKSNINELSDYLICKEGKNLLARFIAYTEMNS